LESIDILRLQVDFLTTLMVEPFENTDKISRQNHSPSAFPGLILRFEVNAFAPGQMIKTVPGQARSHAAFIDTGPRQGRVQVITSILVNGSGT
jgi:hypothetical protein